MLRTTLSNNENIFFCMNPMTVKTLMLRKTSQEKAEFLFRQNGDHVLPITQIKYKDRSIYDDYIGSPGFLASLTQVQLYALFQLEFKNTLFLDALFLMDKRRLVCFFDKPGQNYCNPLYYAVIHHNVKFFDYLFREETILKIGSETVTSFLKDRFYFYNRTNFTAPAYVLSVYTGTY